MRSPTSLGFLEREDELRQALLDRIRLHYQRSALPRRAT